MTLPTEGNAVTSQKNAELGSATSSVKPIDPHTRFIVVGVIVVGSFIALLNQTVMSPALAFGWRIYQSDSLKSAP